jgi:hypothetical protein
MDSLYSWEPSFTSRSVMKDPEVEAVGSHSEGLVKPTCHNMSQLSDALEFVVPSLCGRTGQPCSTGAFS